MTNDLDERVRDILGEERWDGLGKGEKEAARDVAKWYEGATSMLTMQENKVVEALWVAAREELGERAGLLNSPRRYRDVTDVRFTMFLIARELLPRIPKRHIPEALGIRRDHASTLYAISRSKELIHYDPAFRMRYYRMVRRVANYAGTKIEGTKTEGDAKA